MGDRTAPALLDTDAYSLLFLKRESADDRVPGWRRLLEGRRVVISFQTRAEVLSGAHAAGWGESRMTRLRAQLDSTPTIAPDETVVDAYARLYAECRRQGHALQDKLHVGDRWVAACAIAKRLELLAGDALYAGAPDLTLLV